MLKVVKKIILQKKVVVQNHVVWQENVDLSLYTPRKFERFCSPGAVSQTWIIMVGRGSVDNNFDGYQ